MKKSIYLLLSILMSVATTRLFAQEDFYKVYQYETPLIGFPEIAVYNTYIPSSDLNLKYFGKNLSRQNLWAHSVEAELAVTDHFSVGAYADFEDPNGGKFNYVRSHLEARIRFFQRYDKWVNTGIYLEYYLPRSSYSKSQELEARLILDKDFNDFRVVLNPKVSVYTTGDEDKSLQPGIDGGIYYRRCKVQPGVEFYSNFKEKTASVFPSANIFLSPHISWNLGLGFGLNRESDDMTIKSILQFDVMAIRPSKLFSKRINKR
ncbi:MAG TPA: hypothetical protein VLI68_15385 [Hanamia sp.]|jgi:hypothetical protein|nr:hypothetical protein [Hanamia sp.]